MKFLTASTWGVVGSLRLGAGAAMPSAVYLASGVPKGTKRRCCFLSIIFQYVVYKKEKARIRESMAGMCAFYTNRGRYRTRGRLHTVPAQRQGLGPRAGRRFLYLHPRYAHELKNPRRGDRGFSEGYFFHPRGTGSEVYNDFNPGGEVGAPLGKGAGCRLPISLQRKCQAEDNDSFLKNGKLS